MRAFLIWLISSVLGILAGSLVGVAVNDAMAIVPVALLVGGGTCQLLEWRRK